MEPPREAARSQQEFCADVQRDTHLLQINIRQIREHRDIDVVISKSLPVLPEAELLKPVRNLLHRDDRFLIANASGSAAPRAYPTRRKIEGRFLAGLTFPRRLLAIADEVIDPNFRNASIEGGEVTLWVIFDRSGKFCLPVHVRFARAP